MSVVSADVVKRSCAYVVFYRRRPLHDVEQRRAQIAAAVSAAAATAARAAVAGSNRSSLSPSMPVSALDAQNLVCVLLNKFEVCFSSVIWSRFGCLKCGCCGCRCATLERLFRIHDRAHDGLCSTCRRPAPYTWAISSAFTVRCVLMLANS